MFDAKAAVRGIQELLLALHQGTTHLAGVFASVLAVAFAAPVHADAPEHSGMVFAGAMDELQRHCLVERGGQHAWNPVPSHTHIHTRT